MSESKFLVLKTDLYKSTDKTALHDCLDNTSQLSTIVVDPTTMQVADWDKVLKKVLDHDQCITL